jgi:PAT family beta-lactamase induction signal transducer AmpG
MAKFIDAFRSWRVAVMLLLGFGSGLPNPLIGSTLAAWLKDANLTGTMIGGFALTGLPYNLKFMWAALVDRYHVPVLGRRRGWMLLLQLLLLVALLGFATLEPRSSLQAMAVVAFLVAFLSASQDVVVDAYRTDVLTPAERGSGTAVFVAGYRVALIASGAGALILSDHVPWRLVYLISAALMGVGIVGTLVAPRPALVASEPQTLYRAVVDPLSELLGREGIGAILAILVLYKVGDGVASFLLTPFLMDVGFSKTEIGALQKGTGLVASIVGSLLGGGLLARFGLRRSLITFGVLQASANVLYIVLAESGPSHGLLVWAVGIDALCGGLGTAAFVAFMMSLCDHRYTAFQYALISSAGTVGARILAAAGGKLADSYGWSLFFVVTIVAALPAIVLLFGAKIGEEEAQAAEPGEQ